MNVDITRRSAVKNMMAATVALTGGAVALPAVANAVPQWKDRALPLAVNDARPELRDAIHAFDAAHDKLLSTGRAHHAALKLYSAWEKKNHQPSPTRGVRAWRKWRRRADKYEEEISFYPSYDAHQAASRTYREAQRQLARVRALNFDELALKSAAAMVFEGAILDREEDRRSYRHQTAYVAMSVAMDCTLLATGYEGDAA